MAKRAEPTEEKVLIDGRTLARRLACSDRHLKRLRADGMPWIPVRNLVRYDWDEVMAWLRSNRPSDDRRLVGYRPPRARRQAEVVISPSLAETLKFITSRSPKPF